VSPSLPYVTNTTLNSTKANNTKFSKTKHTMVQSPLTTAGQKTRWAYSTTLLSPHFNFNSRINF